MVAAARQVTGQMQIHQARFDHRVTILKIHLQNPVHPSQGDHHTATNRQTTTSQTRSRAAWHKGNIVLVARPDNLNHLGRRRRKQHHVR